MLYQLVTALLPLVVATTFLVLKARQGGGAPAVQNEEPAQAPAMAPTVANSTHTHAPATTPPVEVSEQPPPPQSDAHTSASQATSSSSSGSAVAVSSCPASSSSASSSSSSSSPASPSSRPVPAADADDGRPTLTLRFLQGETPITMYACDLSTPIRELKQQVARATAAASAGTADGATADPASGTAATGGAPSRIMWIFQGQLLRDEKVLTEYKMAAGDIIHVHVIRDETAAAANNANDDLRHRPGAAPAAPVAGPQGQYLIPPPVAVAPQAAQLMMHLSPVAFLCRIIFALFTSLLGILWGIAMVFGGQLFSSDALFVLIFFTGIMFAGIFQTAVLDARHPAPA